MNCPHCNNNIQSTWKVCPFCANPLSTACKNCSFELQPDWKTCPSCGVPAVATSTITSAQHPQSEKLCGTSGKPIREQDECFKCKDCEEFHLEQYRFQDGIAICKTCAHQDGSAEAYEQEQKRKAKEEADKLSEIHKKVEAEYQAKLQQELSKIKSAQVSVEKTAKSKQSVLPITDNDFVSIPAGSYKMGSSESELLKGEDERQHEVYVAPFELMKTPVTFAQFQNYCEQIGIAVPDDHGWGKEQHPVINVSYWDAVDFCKWMSKQTGYVYRLPTEAEWEYACRAGTETTFYFGDYIPQTEIAHCKSAVTAATRSFPANPWGLFDMYGNVWEWCASLYDGEYKGKEQKSACEDRSNNNKRVIRGGYWASTLLGCYSAKRHKVKPDVTSGMIGFRVARSK